MISLYVLGVRYKFGTIALVGMTGLGWEWGSFKLGQIDFPSVVAVIAGLSMDAVREVSSSFGDFLVVALAYNISRHF
jgi:hypothetical protein